MKQNLRVHPERNTGRTVLQPAKTNSTGPNGAINGAGQGAAAPYINDGSKPAAGQGESGFEPDILRQEDSICKACALIEI
jgi:hypothetical protein